MFNVCPKCGMYHADKIIDVKGPYAVCPECGHNHPFKQLPLFIITGASGAGKSTVCAELLKTSTEAVIFESDVLWRQEFATAEDDYRSYRELCLRVCKNISQAGKPVALFGSTIPSQFESCTERRYFSDIHYLALVCEDDILRERLKQRPAWRNCGSDEFIQGHIQFNNWFKANSEKTNPGMTLLDTSYDTFEESAVKIRKWIAENLFKKF